jgi:hypothetical protein
VVFIKKVSIMLLTISIFFVSMFVLPMKKAEAVTFSPSAMAKATKVIRGIGENIGVKWTIPSLAAVVGYILSDKSPEGLSFVGDIPVMDGQISLDGTSKRLLLSPDDFKNGVKLLKKSQENITDGATINRLCLSGVSVGPIYNTPPSTYYYADWLFTDGITDYVLQKQVYSGSTKYFSSIFLTSWVGAGVDQNNNPLVHVYYSKVATVSGSVYTYDELIQLPKTFNSDGFNCQSSYTATSGDVPNMSYVNTTIFNNIDNSTTNYNYYPNYPIDIPVADVTDDVENIWNTTIINEVINNIYPPAVVDTDNDGLPDDKDITPGGEVPVPDDTGIFAKLFPVLLIVKLFGVLGSCLMYLIRMFQFIMTIPGIDAIPIDNDAFVWFRSAQIVGIKIYDVVSSLAGVGLSFIVFRAIRRAYL